MPLPLPSRRRVGAAVIATAMVAATQATLLVSPAAAATTLTVSTTADIAANAGACGSSGITTPPTPLSLREATCLANNIGGAVTIDLPAGHYTLSNGELQLGSAAGQSATISGAGAATTLIDGNNASRVLDLDFNVTGGVTTSITGVTIENGRDDTLGGAGIIGGSNNKTTADHLTLANVRLTGNHANFAVPTTNNNSGGAVQFFGGSLAITDSQIDLNSSGSSDGSGVAFLANGFAAGESLAITRTTFDSNSYAMSSSGTFAPAGGALSVGASGAQSLSVTDSTFTNNTATATAPNTAVGAGIWLQSGTLSVTGTTFTGNTASGNGSPTGSAIYASSGTVNAGFDLFHGNSAAAVATGASGPSIVAHDDWWGCNTGSAVDGCDTTSGTVSAVPRLVLTGSASPATVTGPNATSTLTASLLTDSAGATLSGSSFHAFDGLPVSFSDPAGSATVTTSPGSHSVNLLNGTSSIDYHSNTVVGVSTSTAAFQSGSVPISVTVQQPPALTSAASTTAVVGHASSFTVTTTGYPAPAIAESGALPSGLTFHDNGDGTATLGGTPAAGSAGTYPLTLTASNVAGPSATQSFTLTVDEAPAFTSATTATFTRGVAGSFAITTSGTPGVSSILESGTLPAGLTFSSTGSGASISGTPTGAAGSYPVTLTASNGVSPDAVQNLTIVVDEAPVITTQPLSQTVQPGTTVSFTAAASGFPAPTVQWQRSTNGGTSFSDVATATSTTYTFTAAAGDDQSQYRAVFTNPTGSATSSAATLRVGTAPSFTSANSATFTAGTAGSFNLTTTGVPGATITVGAGMPAWLTLSSSSGGAATLSGTPPAGSGGTYSFTLTADNGFSPTATQTFTLTVDEAPAFTSADHTTFTVGQAGTFSITSAGYPPSTLTETGALPAGVTFTAGTGASTGTATLQGTPAAGSAGDYVLTINGDNGLHQSSQQLTLHVVKQQQTITDTSQVPATPTVGGHYDLSATSSSGLTVSFTLVPTTACSLVGTTVHFDAAGHCEVDYDQAGDGTYAAAPQVSDVFDVVAMPTVTTVVSSVPSAVYGQPTVLSATVTAGAAGTVQFTVDGVALGTPVTVSGGSAQSVPVTDGLGHPLAPGAHPVAATFTPADPAHYAGSSGSGSQVVTAAGTTTTLSVGAHTLTSVVAPVAPGAGTPTGTVQFSVAGVSIGSASLSGGTATLSATVPPGQSRTVAAVYSGDADFSGSSASLARTDPLITATLSSSAPVSSFGWYHTPVTVTFHCTATSAPLTAPCPATVTLSSDGGGQSVSRTVQAADGGAATVAVTGIDIDQTPPVLRVVGLGGADPRPRCVATDALSGVASCTITRHTSGTRTSYVARATDRAGNVTVVRGHYRSTPVVLLGAPFHHGAYEVRLGQTYTLVVIANTRPAYYDAAVYPLLPTRRDNEFHAAGRHRWAVGVTMSRMSGHTYWSLGVLVDGMLRTVKVRVVG